MFYGDQLVHLLLYLVFSEIMAPKNFVFMENWVGSEVAGLKIAFFAIFDSNQAHILEPKGPNMEFLKQNFNFQSLGKTEAILLPSM